RRRHTSSKRDWSSDVCSSDLLVPCGGRDELQRGQREALRGLVRSTLAGDRGLPGRGRPGLPSERVLEVRAGRFHVLVESGQEEIGLRREVRVDGAFGEARFPGDPLEGRRV